MSRDYDNTTVDADAVCEKVSLVADCISEADMTLHTQLSRIACALEKLAGIAPTRTAGTMA